VLRKEKIKIVIYSFIILGLSSCSTQNTEGPELAVVESRPVPSQDAVGNGEALAYPGPVESTREFAPYPAPNSTPPVNPNKVSIVPFRFDRPLLVGATEVTGTGPSGVPILVVDLTAYGKVLAEGTIRPDGTFKVTLPFPLEANHRIGLSTNDLSNTGWTEDTFSDPGFFGEDPQLVPMIGFYFDTILIEAK
jgi:hypothetical protein